MKIHFWGSTDDVTGSMTFLKLPEGTILIDCGLAQGSLESDKINSLQLPVAPSEIKAVVITHAHLDHTGYLPRLVKKGFKGTIFCTPSTAKLMRIILLDSAKLNDDGFYEVEDVQNTLHLVKTYDWNQTFNITDTNMCFIPAGHILGASSVVINNEGKRIVFSGDLGRFEDPILPTHPICPQADIVVMESTYGNKIRQGNVEKELHTFLTTVSRESRVGIVASFAVARAQTILTLIHEFFSRHPEEKVRVVIDSPMMAEANKVYQQYSHLTKHNESVFSALNGIDTIDFQGEWESLKKKKGPLIILSSSGMLTGGRINRHLYNWHDDAKAILYLPGYQGVGTPGRSLLEGNRTLQAPSGELFKWQGEIWNSDAFSSHADQKELLEWIAENKTSKIFLLHGERGAKNDLMNKLNSSSFPDVTIPKRGDCYKI